jgi:GR25 family glycosyltransferase involved in LPS biosynthesis
MTKAIPSIDMVFCINLESSKDRREHMKEEFKKLGVTYSFINAIHPQTNTYISHIKNPKLVDTGVNRRCYCTSECPHRGRKLRPTEVAISLSHYAVYHKIIKNHYYWSLVCEDDISFIKNFPELINKVIPLNIIESDKPIIIFCGGANDNHNLMKTDPNLFNIINLRNGCYSNYCYLINYHAANILAKNMWPIKRPEDSAKRHIIAKKKIEAYRFQPSIIAELSAGRNMAPIYQRTSTSFTVPENDLRSKPNPKDMKNYKVIPHKWRKKTHKSKPLITPTPKLIPTKSTVPTKGIVPKKLITNPTKDKKVNKLTVPKKSLNIIKVTPKNNITLTLKVHKNKKK